MTGTSAAVPQRGRSAAVVYAALLLLIVGSAIPIPLLPLYGELLGLTADRIALVFSSYLATMVVALGLGSIPATQSRPRMAMSAALVLALSSDVLFLIGSEPALLIGRILTGFSVGFGLGAGATLSVMLRGDHGRSVAATMTMVAGFIGILGSALLADLTPWPTQAPFLVHLVLAGVVLFLLVRARIPSSSRVAEPAHESRPTRPPSTSTAPTRTAVMTGAAVGILSWSMGNVVVGLGPTLVKGAIGTESVLAASFVAVLVAALGIAAQYSVPTSRLRWSTSVATALLLLGALSVALGTASAVVIAVLAGGALIGAGQGAGYRLGMLAVTRGLPPRRHGARTSLYAGVAYVGAATSVQVGGALMAEFGNEAGMLILLTALTVPVALLMTVGAFGRWRPVPEVQPPPRR